VLVLINKFIASQLIGNCHSAVKYSYCSFLNLFVCLRIVYNLKNGNEQFNDRIVFA